MCVAIFFLNDASVSGRPGKCGTGMRQASACRLTLMSSRLTSTKRELGLITCNSRKLSSLVFGLIIRLSSSFRRNCTGRRDNEVCHSNPLDSDGEGFHRSRVNHIVHIEHRILIPMAYIWRSSKIISVSSIKQHQHGSFYTPLSGKEFTTSRNPREYLSS